MFRTMVIFLYLTFLISSMSMISVYGSCSCVAKLKRLLLLLKLELTKTLTHNYELVLFVCDLTPYVTYFSGSVHKILLKDTKYQH